MQSQIVLLSVEEIKRVLDSRCMPIFKDSNIYDENKKAFLAWVKKQYNKFCGNCQEYGHPSVKFPNETNNKSRAMPKISTATTTCFVQIDPPTSTLGLIPTKILNPNQKSDLTLMWFVTDTKFIDKLAKIAKGTKKGGNVIISQFEEEDYIKEEKEYLCTDNESVVEANFIATEPLIENEQAMS